MTVVVIMLLLLKKMEVTHNDIYVDKHDNDNS